jgi:hypothetical protein
MQVAKNLAVHGYANLSVHGEASLARTEAAAIVPKLAFLEKEKFRLQTCMK